MVMMVVVMIMMNEDKESGDVDDTHGREKTSESCQPPSCSSESTPP